MKHFFLIILLLAGKSQIQAQVHIDFTVDTSRPSIRTAVRLLANYIAEFHGKQLPDYGRYWRSASPNRAKLPDDMVYSISSDGPLYRFSRQPTIFFARQRGRYVHLKTLFSRVDTGGRVGVWAITNHYVVTSEATPYFVPALELQPDRYATTRNGNITYHYPKSCRFRKKTSDSMLARLAVIERQWGFQPVAIDYFFAEDKEDLARMRGCDYVLAMDDPHPSGISMDQYRTIYCEGLGEGYLHEVLHQYFNPLYVQSPLTHGLIYYLAGGGGIDFNAIIRKMQRYLETYPETDLTGFPELQARDKTLHIDYAVTGLLCKMIDEKHGVSGLKRALAYKTVDEVLQKEFGVDKGGWDRFLKAAIQKYSTVP